MTSEGLAKTLTQNHVSEVETDMISRVSDSLTLRLSPLTQNSHRLRDEAYMLLVYNL